MTDRIEQVKEILEKNAEYDCGGGGEYELCKPFISNSVELAKQIDALYQPSILTGEQQVVRERHIMEETLRKVGEWLDSAEINSTAGTKLPTLERMIANLKEGKIE